MQIGSKNIHTLAGGGGETLEIVHFFLGEEGMQGRHIETVSFLVETGKRDVRALYQSYKVSTYILR